MLRVVTVSLAIISMGYTAVCQGAVQRVRNNYHSDPKPVKLHRSQPRERYQQERAQSIYTSSHFEELSFNDDYQGYDFDYNDEPFEEELIPRPKGLVEEKIKGRSKYPNYGFPSKMISTGKREIHFSPVYLAWAAYDEQGHLVKTGAASGGADWCADIGSRCRTPAGKYNVQRIMTKHYRSKSFPRRADGNHGGAPMAYAMFFHRGYALHHSASLPQRNASHGCVRLDYQSAQWLNTKFVRKGTGVTVHPYRNPPYDPAALAWNE